MKAIILAAGEGKRLRPLTDQCPKCILEYRGMPIIDHILNVMRSVGLNDILLIKGYHADKLVRKGTRELINNHYASTNMVSTLFCSEKEWNDDLIISYADIVYEQYILEALVGTPSDFAVVIDKDWRSLWQKRMRDPLDDAETLKVDKNGYIVELGKKPSGYHEIEGQYIGLIKIRKSITKKIQDFYHSLDRTSSYEGKDFDNMYMTTFIQLVIDNLMPVKAVSVSGGWVEIDTLKDLQSLE